MSNALMELLKQKKAQLGASRRAKTVKPPLNHSRWRILPSWDKNNEVFYHDFGQHFIKNASGEMLAVYMCVDKTYNKPCSVCTAIQHAINHSADDGMIDLLKQAKSSHRVLMNAVQVDGPNPTTPVILEVAPTVFESIVNNVMEWGAELISLDKGRDIMIEKTGAGKNTKYSVQVSAKSTPLDPSIMSKITNLDEYVAQESDEAASRALSNLAGITGLLPPLGARPVARPSLPSPTALRDITPESEDITEVDESDEALRQLEIESKATTAANVTEKVKTNAVKDAPAAPVVSGSTGDAELDAMVAELEALSGK